MGRRRARRGTLLVLGGVWACVGEAPVGSAAAGRATEGPLVVELFAPGAVSTALPEFAAAFTPSGDTLFFNRTSEDRSRIDLLVSVRVDGVWSDAEAFQPLAGERAIDPFVAPAGDVLYFSSDRAGSGRADGSFNLWAIDLDSGGTPRPLPFPVNTDSSEVFNSLAADGTMVFSSRRDGERRLYGTRLARDGTWEEVRLLAVGGITEGSNPAVDPDGRWLVFARSGPDGTSDLLVSCQEEDGWGEPVTLPPPINGPFTEFAPALHGPHLYFTSERPGIAPAGPPGTRPPGDLYRTSTRALEAICQDVPDGD